jgi:hypothetical protein
LYAAPFHCGLGVGLFYRLLPHPDFGNPIRCISLCARGESLFVHVHVQIPCFNTCENTQRSRSGDPSSISCLANRPRAQLSVGHFSLVCQLPTRRRQSVVPVVGKPTSDPALPARSAHAGVTYGSGDLTGSAKQEGWLPCLR